MGYFNNKELFCLVFDYEIKKNYFELKEGKYLFLLILYYYDI